MKVVCRRLINPVTFKEVDVGPWAEIGSEYVVLELSSKLGGRTWLRILADGKMPHLLLAEMFETTSSRIPSNWSIHLSGDLFNIRPKSWSRPGFWEEYFDREPSAVSDFERELALITAEV